MWVTFTVIVEYITLSIYLYSRTAVVFQYEPPFHKTRRRQKFKLKCSQFYLILKFKSRSHRDQCKVHKYWCTPTTDRITCRVEVTLNLTQQDVNGLFPDAMSWGFMTREEDWGTKRWDTMSLGFIVPNEYRKSILCLIPLYFGLEILVLM